MYSIISVVLIDFMRETGCKALRSEESTVVMAPDPFSGGVEEFVTMNNLQRVGDKRFVLVVGVKESNTELPSN